MPHLSGMKAKGKYSYCLNKHKVKIILAYSGLALAVLNWAANTTIARGVVFDIKPMALSFFRWATAFIIILPFALKYLKHDNLIIRKNIKSLFVLSIFSVALYNSLLYVGAQYTTATNISLVVATMPGITLILAWLINREKPTFMKVAGVIIALCGMSVTISKFSLDNLVGMNFNKGDMFTVFSIISWALYSVLLKRSGIDIHPVSLLTVLIFFGTLLIFPFYLWEFFVFAGFTVNAKTVLIFLFLAVFPSIISYICWNHGVKTVGPGTAAMFMNLLPIFTAFFAFFFLGEKIYFYHIVGGVSIFVGLYIARG